MAYSELLSDSQFDRLVNDFGQERRFENGSGQTAYTKCGGYQYKLRSAWCFECTSCTEKTLANLPLLSEADIAETCLLQRV